MALRIILLLASALFSLPMCWAVDDGTAEHIVWDKSPIPVTLSVGQERRIDFPVPIKLVAPGAVVEASKPIQIREDGSVYWTALQPFSTQRVQAITFTGYSYFLDVTAVESGPTHPIIVLDDRVPEEDNPTKEAVKRALTYDYDDVDLVRYAAQSIYAPQRLIKPLAGVRQMPVPKREYALYRHSGLTTEPMTQWRSPTVPSRYVTAVRVTSNTLDDIEFDPRLLRGQWLSAASQHGTIHAAGTDGDTTTWYLVSAFPFEEVCP